MSGYNIKIIVFFLKIFFTFTKIVDPEEIQNYAAFHLDLHCLQKYSFRRIQMVKLKHEFSIRVENSMDIDDRAPDNFQFNWVMSTNYPNYM